jgi:hypothetical protein
MAAPFLFPVKNAPKSLNRSPYMCILYTKLSVAFIRKMCIIRWLVSHLILPVSLNTHLQKKIEV